MENTIQKVLFPTLQAPLVIKWNNGEIELECLVLLVWLVKLLINNFTDNEKNKNPLRERI